MDEPTRMAPQPVPRVVAPTLGGAARVALVSRVVTITAGLVSAVLLPLVLAPASVGLYFLAVSVAAGLATVAQMGLTSVGPAVATDAIARDDLASARRLVATMAALCLATGLTVVAVASSVQLAAADDTRTVGIWHVIGLVSVLAMFSATATVASELLRATHAVRSAAALAGAASTPAAAYGVWALGTGGRTGVTGVLLTCVVCAAACAVTGLVLLARRTRGWGAPARPRLSGLGAILRRAVPVMLTTLLLFLIAAADLWLVSALGSLDEVARYGLALRCATLILVPLGIVNGAAAPLVVHARSAGDTQEVARVVDGVVRTGVLAALAIYAVFAVTAYWLIQAWQPSYSEVYGLVLVLGAGCVLHACGGAAGVLLMVWGDQRGALVLTVAAGAATVVLCVAGYLALGVFGLAAGAAVGNALQTVLFVGRARRHFEIDPSVLRLRRSRRAAA